MCPLQTAPAPLETLKPEAVATVLSDELKDLIIERMARGESPWFIAADLQASRQIEIDGDRVLACWNARKNPASPADRTRTGPGQEKESMPIPHDSVTIPIPQRMAPADGPPPVIADAGQGEDDETEIAPPEVRAFIVDRMARREAPSWIAKQVQTEFGFQVDRDEILVCWRDRDALPTRTGPGQEKNSMQKLTDEVKEFIVKRLACYETPSRIAAAVRVNFGIDIDRRRIFEYDPAGSRPPAQRWIDLHAATRARFLSDVSEIGVAQKTMRLRMLDRLAQMAEDDNRHDKAAKFLEQAARECGGFYERRPRAAAPTEPAHAKPEL